MAFLPNGKGMSEKAPMSVLGEVTTGHMSCMIQACCQYRVFFSPQCGVNLGTLKKENQARALDSLHCLLQAFLRHSCPL